MTTERTIPTPLQTLLAIIGGYRARVFQARGIVLAAIAVAPMALLTLVVLIARRHDPIPPTGALQVFHLVIVPFLLPILALVAAPAGIREDIEQRTLPLMLVRPQPVWVLPMAKGLLWFAWGAPWLVLSSLFLPVLGLDPARLPAVALTLVLAYWAQLGFLSLLTLVFKRGVLWGALFFFAWDPLVRIMPSNLQRFTFLHYIESLVGSRGGGVNAAQILAQDQISTAPWLAALVLIAIGLACWIACGMKLEATALGLAGREAEG